MMLSSRKSKRKKKDKKERWKKNSKNRKAWNVIKRDASSKKGKLSCCKCFFDQIKANFAEIQPKNHQNVQKTHFLQKVPGVSVLMMNSWESMCVFRLHLY